MEQKRNHFLDGLVLGAAIGSAAVFLLGTKKGREVLKVLQEEGRERFSQLEGMFSSYQEAMGEEEDYHEDDLEEVINELPTNVSKSVSDKHEKTKTDIRKKLFKGISRRK